jgi:hypothetical protein
MNPLYKYSKGTHVRLISKGLVELNGPMTGEVVSSTYGMAVVRWADGSDEPMYNSEIRRINKRRTE